MNGNNDEMMMCNSLAATVLLFHPKQGIKYQFENTGTLMQNHDTFSLFYR